VVSGKPVEDDFGAYANELDGAYPVPT
jgi:hypothetical protein